MKKNQLLQQSCAKDRLFTSELKSSYVRYLYHLLLNLKQCDLVDCPYHNAQVNYLINLEEDVQPPHNLLESEQTLYRSTKKMKNTQKSNIRPSYMQIANTH